MTSGHGHGGQAVFMLEPLHMRLKTTNLVVVMGWELGQ